MLVYVEIPLHLSFPICELWIFYLLNMNLYTEESSQFPPQEILSGCLLLRLNLAQLTGHHVHIVFEIYKGFSGILWENYGSVLSNCACSNMIPSPKRLQLQFLSLLVVPSLSTQLKERSFVCLWMRVILISCQSGLTGFISERSWVILLS